MPSHARLVWVALACAVACTDPPPGPDDEGEDCFMYQPPAESADWPARNLELGTLDDDGTFTPWVDGAPLPAVRGYQGFWMLLPAFSVARENEDGASACWFVRVDVGDPEREEGPVLSGVYPGGLSFAAAGDHMRAGPLFHVIEEAEIGTTQRMDVSVFGEGFSASTSVTYTIE